ncbi:IS5 family transposase [Streptomyces sp. ADI95-16]|uniref:IS5 family transposase n=1 Tax=Streptomyces sp. ADI95-16 TaxID=1522758 RepID=UPI0026671EB4|nr:IS5 family transposase [Streptomyces sp. ADI95-16]
MGRGVLSDAEWERLRPFLPVSNRRCGRWRDHRQVIDGILHRVRTGVHWCDLPERFGPRKPVYERHRLWSADGTWERLLQQVEAAADAAGEIDWDVSVDSTIVPAHQHTAGARTDPPPAPASRSSSTSCAVSPEACPAPGAPLRRLPPARSHHRPAPQQDCPPGRAHRVRTRERPGGRPEHGPRARHRPPYPADGIRRRRRPAPSRPGSPTPRQPPGPQRRRTRRPPVRPHALPPATRAQTAAAPATSCAPPPTRPPTTAPSTWSWPEAFDYLEERFARALIRTTLPPPVPPRRHVPLLQHRDPEPLRRPDDPHRPLVSPAVGFVFVADAASIVSRGPR